MLINVHLLYRRTCTCFLQDDDEGGLSNGFLVQLLFTAGGLMGQAELDTLAAEVHTSDAVPDTIADHLTPSHYRLR